MTIFLFGMKKLYRYFWIPVLCILMMPTSILARDQPYISNVFLGFSARSLDYDYYRSADDLVPTGTMTSDIHLSPLFRIQLPYQMYGKHPWGWYTEFEAKPFQLNQQLVSDQVVDLETVVNGWFWHVTPVVFYRWQISKNTDVFHIMQGLGVGLGYQDVSGRMILTEDMSNEAVHIDSSGFDLSVSVMTEFQYQFWLVRIHAGGPILDQKNFSTAVFDLSLELAYRIPLEDLF